MLCSALPLLCSDLLGTPEFPKTSMIYEVFFKYLVNVLSISSIWGFRKIKKKEIKKIIKTLIPKPKVGWLAGWLASWLAGRAEERR